MTFTEAASTGRHYSIRGQDFYALAHRSPFAVEGEAALLAQGMDLPADHRVEWARAWGSLGSVIEVWSGSTEGPVARVVVDAGESAALPGHEIWRVDRLSPNEGTSSLEAALAGLSDFARASRRVLSVVVGLATPDQEARTELGAYARGLGYRLASRMRGYERTLRIDLTRTEKEIFGGLHASCRRGIRAVSKNSMEVRPVTDPSSSARLRSLLEETMARTGGQNPSVEWRRVIGFANDHPDVVRLVGMYSTRGTGELLAFALGLRQGDHVEYRTAASTRLVSSVPLGYAVAWDLVRWAKRIGADWFDFGGLPREPVPKHLQGIVRFKSSFGGEPIELREEWVLETRPLLESIRRGLSRAADVFRR